MKLKMSHNPQAKSLKSSLKVVMVAIKLILGMSTSPPEPNSALPKFLFS